MNEVQTHPVIFQLQKERELLREELANLLAEHNELTDQVGPYLLALYQQRLGSWELRRLAHQAERARVKRVLELIQAYLNRGEAPDWPAVQAKVAAEQEEWHQRIREAAEKLNHADHLLKHLLSAEETARCRKLYRTLVRRLHPDLHPEPDERHQLLWHRLQRVYQNGDLEGMATLLLLTEDDTEVIPPSRPIENLREELRELNRQIERLLREINTLNAQPPFCWVKQLQDEIWVNQRRVEMEKEIEDLRQQTVSLQERLLILAPGVHYVQQFGPH